MNALRNCLTLVHSYRNAPYGAKRIHRPAHRGKMSDGL